MNPTETRILGKSGVPVTQLGFGGAGLGELFVRVDETTAAATLKAAWDAGIRYYDTAPFYGQGLSEIRTGRFLDNQPRSEFILSTKVGRWFFLQQSRTPSKPGGSAGFVSSTSTTTAMTASCEPMTSRRCGSE